MPPAGNPPFRPRREQVEEKESHMASQESTELARRASLIYEQGLRGQLEATNRDDFVAIEPESGDFFLGKTLSEAVQAARAAHPACLSFALRVGHEATVDMGAAVL